MSWHEFGDEDNGKNNNDKPSEFLSVMTLAVILAFITIFVPPKGGKSPGLRYAKYAAIGLVVFFAIAGIKSVIQS